MTLSVVIALVTVWVGHRRLLPDHWPLGFFVGVMGAVFFLLGKDWSRRHGRARPAH